MARKYRARKLRALLGFALLFILLGAGNIAIGYSRASEYELLIEEATKSTPNPALLEGVGLPAQTENLANKESHIRRLHARLDFYKVVIAGGKCFLGLAGFMLLFFLLLSRDPNPKPLNT